MTDVSKAMGPNGKVALDNECSVAIQKVTEFKEAINGVIAQIEGVINGLKTDYSGEGADRFYDACRENIEQMKKMVDDVCNAYAGDDGLFRSIEKQILTATESLNKTLESTNQKFGSNSN